MTEKQQKAYEALKASIAANDKARQIAAFSNGTPTGGWASKDQVAK